VRILGISGSLQARSANLTLLEVAAASAPDGVEIVIFDGLRDLPPFDADLEASGAPPAVLAWRQAIAAHGLGLTIRPQPLVLAWVEAFNRGDADALASFYAPDAVNHQVAEAPVEGREAIRQMFVSEFARARMVCIVENIFEDGAWAILEWRDPKGLRGCGFFHVANGQIVLQRGYWDKLSFLRQQGLPLPKE
jgi:limonene-1,2-epoxide hydrolase